MSETKTREEIIQFYRQLVHEQLLQSNRLLTKDNVTELHLNEQTMVFKVNNLLPVALLLVAEEMTDFQVTFIGMTLQLNDLSANTSLGSIVSKRYPKTIVENFQ